MSSGNNSSSNNDLDNTNTNGDRLFIRHRANAASVRLRRRTNKASEDEVARRIRTRAQRLSGGDFEDNWDMEIKVRQEDINNRRRNRPRAYSDDWDEVEDKDEEDFSQHRNGPHRQSMSGLNNTSSSRHLMIRCSPMETLDRRISLSTDQLDTLKKKKKENVVKRKKGSHLPRSVPVPEVSEDEEDEEHMAWIRNRARARSAASAMDYNNNNDENDVEFVYGGERMSKSKYFFGNSSSSEANNKPFVFNRGRTAAIKQRLLQGINVNNNSGNNLRKTSFFLDGDGPYSRRLYGPPPSELSSASKIDEERRRRRRRARSQEHLLMDTNSIEDAIEEVREKTLLSGHPVMRCLPVKFDYISNNASLSLRAWRIVKFPSFIFIFWHRETAGRTLRAKDMNGRPKHFSHVQHKTLHPSA